MELAYDSKVGRGAFGEVWSATDALGRRVAVKFFNDTTPSLAEKNAFDHAKALARVRHPAVVQVLSLERQPHPELDTEALCIIMEFADGPNLSLYASALTVDQARAILTDVSEGLEAIHAAGLVHGDIHDGNILVTPTGAKVIDILYTHSLAEVGTRTASRNREDDLRELAVLFRHVLAKAGLSDDDVKEAYFSAMTLAFDVTSVRNPFMAVLANPNEDGSHRELKLIEAVAHSASSAGTVATQDTGSSTAVRVPTGSSRLQKIANDRLPHWELRLFSQALSDELAASSAERRDMELGISFDLIERRERSEAISWAGTQFSVIARVTTSLASLVNVGLNDAMGPPGEPGDPEKLVYVASRMGQAYREAIAWTLRWRRLHADTAFNNLSELAQTAGTRLVCRIEDWSNRISVTIRDVLDGAGPRVPGTLIDLSVTIDMPAKWEENMAAEMRKLRRHFGVHDDD